MQTLTIQGRLIGEKYPTFIIAEAGLNHNGKFVMAKRLVLEAAKAGADAIKFQTFQAKKLVSLFHPTYGFLKAMEFTPHQWRELAELAKKAGILFLSTPFDKESADFLLSLGMPVFKVASGDLTFLPYVRYIAKKKKPIILSTGMATLQEVREAVGTVYKTGNRQLALLHCISQYPARVQDANLQMIDILKKTFQVPVGFSDQTVGIFASLGAVVLGARIIERHFTLSHKLPGPDHQCSVDPQELANMVEGIRVLEKSQGHGWPRVRPDASEKKAARRTIIAARRIPRGKHITATMLKVVRAGNKGLPPKFFEKVVGRVTKKDILAEQPLTKNLI